MAEGPKQTPSWHSSRYRKNHPTVRTQPPPPPMPAGAMKDDKSHKAELGIEFCIELAIVFYQLGRELMGLPANVPLGAGCWVVAMLIAIRILWILPFTSLVPVSVKGVTSIAIFIIAVMVSRRTVQEAYRKQSAGEELTSDTKALLSALGALEGRIDAIKKNEPSSVPDKPNLGRPREHTHVKLKLGSVRGTIGFHSILERLPDFLWRSKISENFPCGVASSPRK